MSTKPTRGDRADGFLNQAPLAPNLFPASEDVSLFAAFLHGRHHARLCLLIIGGQQVCEQIELFLIGLENLAEISASRIIIARVCKFSFPAEHKRLAASVVLLAGLYIHLTETIYNNSCHTCDGF